MESRTNDGGFEVDVDLRAWADDDSMHAWRFPYEVTAKAKSKPTAGTVIRINPLREEIRKRVSDPKLHASFVSAIAQTYAAFIGPRLSISVNGTSIVPSPIPIAQSASYTPSRESYDANGVHVRIIAGLGARSEDRTWKMERAGWYVVCNGRVIVSADKSVLTGWGSEMQQFHSSTSRGFVGVALFSSDDPLSLPWTTTKRDLNEESPVFLQARQRMAAVARPVVAFLNKMSSPGGDDTAEERELVKDLKQGDLRTETAAPQAAFQIRREVVRVLRTTVRVQFDAENDDLDKIRDHEGRPSWPATRIGQHCFDYYLEQEGLK